MNLQIINPLEYPGWDDLLLTNDKFSFFHTSSWARVLFESYGYKPVYFSFIDNGKLSTLVPVMEINSFITGKRGISLPFSDICPPVVSDSECFSEAIEQVIVHGRKNGWKSIEWRGGENNIGDKVPSSSYYTHTLDVRSSEKELLSKFRSSTKRNIEKAIRESVHVGTHNSLESVKQFYRLNCMTRKKHGLPPQPFYFFGRIFKHIISPRKGFVVLATYKKRPIAGAVYFHFWDKAIFKYGASDFNFQYLRANNLVMWEGVKWCVRNGIKNLSFGITEMQNQGLVQFKKGWNTREEMIHYYKYSLKNNTFEKDQFRGKTSYLLFQKIPSPLLKFIGFLFYRHVG
jgi:hypothetical protein